MRTCRVASSIVLPDESATTRAISSTARSSARTATHVGSAGARGRRRRRPGDPDARTRRRTGGRARIAISIRRPRRRGPRCPRRGRSRGTSGPGCPRRSRRSPVVDPRGGRRRRRRGARPGDRQCDPAAVSHRSAAHGRSVASGDPWTKHYDAAWPRSAPLREHVGDFFTNWSARPTSRSREGGAHAPEQSEVPREQGVLRAPRRTGLLTPHPGPRSGSVAPPPLGGERSHDRVGDLRRWTTSLRGPASVPRRRKTASTAASTAAAPVISPRWRSIIAPERIIAIGFATPGPAMSGRAPVDRFEDRVLPADVRPGDQPQTADEPGAEVREDVAVQVRKQEDVETTRVPHEPSGQVVDLHVLQLDVASVDRSSFERWAGTGRPTSA